MSEEDTRKPWSRLRDVIEGRGPLPPPPDPEHIALYGGLSGATTELPIFEVVPGLVVREAFAHVFGAYMVAFAKPPNERAPHPGPWVSANGGFGFDVTIEVHLGAGIRPSGFDRLNTIWWFVLLLRLRSGAALRIPVVSSAAFALAAQMATPPMIWSIETQTRQLRLAREIPITIAAADLEWVRRVFLSGSALMSNQEFNRALSLFDSVRWSHDLRAAITLTWTAIEAILKPDTQGKKKSLSAALAAYLGANRQERIRLYEMAAAAYEARSEVTHAATAPEQLAALDTFELARRFFMRVLEVGTIPSAANLMVEWKTSMQHG